jgi:ribosomal protein L24
VLVLSGPHKGETGAVLEKDRDSDSCLVQLADDLSVVKFPMDAVSMTAV